MIPSFREKYLYPNAPQYGHPTASRREALGRPYPTRIDKNQPPQRSPEGLRRVRPLIANR